jgi:hypothetical protein
MPAGVIGTGRRPVPRPDPGVALSVQTTLWYAPLFSEFVLGACD